MSDRELRDEVEALFGELKRERQKAEAPLAAELAPARTALQTQITELTARAKALRERLEFLGAQREERLLETKRALAELDSARAEIARREPLGDPLKESTSNWETRPAGCAVGLWLVLSVALGCAGWWLR